MEENMWEDFAMEQTRMSNIEESNGSLKRLMYRESNLILEEDCDDSYYGDAD